MSAVRQLCQIVSILLQGRFVFTHYLISLSFACVSLKIASKMSAVTSLQVKAEKKRLEEARLIAESQKRANVKVSEVKMFLN